LLIFAPKKKKKRGLEGGPKTQVEQKRISLDEIKRPYKVTWHGIIFRKITHYEMVRVMAAVTLQRLPQAGSLGEWQSALSYFDKGMETEPRKTVPVWRRFA